MLVKWTTLRKFVESEANLCTKSALALMRKHGLMPKWICNNETLGKNDDYVHHNGEPLRLSVNLGARTVEAEPEPAQADLATIMRFAASYSLDTRLGVA